MGSLSHTQSNEKEGPRFPNGKITACAVWTGYPPFDTKNKVEGRSPLEFGVVPEANRVYGLALPAAGAPAGQVKSPPVLVAHQRPALHRVLWLGWAGGRVWNG